MKPQGYTYMMTIVTQTTASSLRKRLATEYLWLALIESLTDMQSMD